MGGVPDNKVHEANMGPIWGRRDPGGPHVGPMNVAIWDDISHDDVIKWTHFPRYWPFVRGIYQSPVNSPHKSQWRGALMFTLICTRINGWVNNREAGDLRRYRAHYDVIVMYIQLGIHISDQTCMHTQMHTHTHIYIYRYIYIYIYIYIRDAYPFNIESRICRIYAVNFEWHFPLLPKGACRYLLRFKET